MLNIDGLATGLDTSTIIDGLLEIQQRQIDQLQGRRDGLIEEQTAFKGIEARLFGLRTEVESLSRLGGRLFEGKTATLSNTDLLDAAASSDAINGTYRLRVRQVAQAHQIGSQGFVEPGSSITEGTLDLRVGNGEVTKITVDSSNNTLQGLVDSINLADGDVTASIIRDLTDPLAPHRILLSSRLTGASNTISVTNNLQDSSGNAVKPIFDGTFVGSATAAATNTSASQATSNRGLGRYTGAVDDTYTFTVVNGGNVGVDSGITVSFQDGSGENTGTITLGPADAGVLQTVAEGVEIQFSAGQLDSGDTFQINVFAEAPPVQAARDAIVTLGSGEGAIEVNDSSNQIETVIPGVTLNLLAEDANTEVLLTVGSDTEAMETAITGFVETFNGVMDAIDEQSRFDAETGIASLLLGNRSAIAIQDSVRRAAIGVVAFVSDQMNQLGAVGIGVSSAGKLTLDAAQLKSALAGTLEGSDLDDVRRLFALDGTTGNSSIRFLAGTFQTQETADLNDPYKVRITGAAEQASITATNALAATTVIDGTNNVLDLTVNGRRAKSIVLTEGSYSRIELAQLLKDSINEAAELQDQTVDVDLDNDQLRITTDAYGLATDLKFEAATNAQAALGFDGTESDNGQDVAGYFLVPGKIRGAGGGLEDGLVIEGADGNGRTLVAQSTVWRYKLDGTPAPPEDPDAEQVPALLSGARLQVTLTKDQVQAPVDTDLTITRGVASRLEQTLDSLLNSVDGRLKRISEEYDGRAQGVQDSIDRLATRFEEAQERLVRQFAALETSVSELQSTSNFLAAQLLGINRIGS